MILYINGQDIKQFAIGFIGKDLHEPVRLIIETTPDAYLGHVHDFLKESNKMISDVEKIVAVVGPGSATALRTTLSIVNTIGFVEGIQLVGVEKDMMEDDHETVQKINDGEAKIVEVNEFLEPIYAHSPRITKSNKDQLKR